MRPVEALATLKRYFDDTNAESPLDFKYLRLLSFMLSSIGSWPHKQFGRARLGYLLSMYNFLLLTIAALLLLGAILYISDKREIITFFDLGHVLLCMFLDVLFMQRLMTALTDKYQETMKYFLVEFHLFYYKDRSPYAKKIHKQIHVISWIFTLVIFFLLLIGVLFFTLMPSFINYRSGMFGPDRPANSTFKHALYYYCYTDDVYTTTEGYWILFFFNITVSINTSNGILMFDLLLSLIVFQVLGHIKIIKHSLLSIPPNNGMHSHEENLRVRESLKDIVEHHKIIIKFVDMCSYTFSEYLFVFYFLMQFITIIELLELTTFTAEAIAMYAIITLSIYQQLILVSILFEMISTKSEELANTVYEVPWECMDTSNRKTVMFLLQRAQTPITLKAAKMVPVGVTTLSAILKTTVSYYMLLKTVASER